MTTREEEEKEDSEAELDQAEDSEAM